MSQKNEKANQNEGKGRRKKRRKQKQYLFWRIVRIWGACLVIAFIALGVLVIYRAAIPFAQAYLNARKVVNESSVDTFRSEQTSIIYDSKDKEMKKLKGDKDVYYLEYNEIPDAAKLALISTEDKHFTTHRGVDLIGITRAVLSLVLHRGQITMGGSTITQQLAKLVFLNFDRTYSRKIKEALIATFLEQKYTKEQILEFYLNNVYFANSYYGIEAAAEGYFDKTSDELTISQIAFLCAIPNSPSRYDPIENKKNTLERRDRILNSMYQDGYIDEDQYKASLEEEISLLTRAEARTNDYAQTYIIKCAAEALMKKEGFEFQTKFDSEKARKAYDEDYSEMYNTCRAKLNTAGYRIYTSIDTQAQQMLQDSVATGLAEFTEKTDDGVFKVQGSAVCIDNDTGMVVAIVGGREENQEGYGLNRAYQSYRQPGSSIKPVLVYGPALDKGYVPDSTLDDTRMQGKDSVSNAGYSYSGYISLRYAVQKSSNVATYRLYQKLGSKTCMAYLEKLHFNGLDKKDYKYDTTSLGGFTKGANAVEMAASYATIENDGKYRHPDCIEKITDTEGNEVYNCEKDYGEEKVYTKNGARMMTDVLESCVSSRRGTASVCRLDVDMPVACKTGTTTDNVDGWLCGYSPYYTTAVWVGRDVYKPVDNLSGNTYPADVWKNFMDKMHRNLARKEFKKPTEVRENIPD